MGEKLKAISLLDGQKGVVIHSLGRSFLSAESNAIAVVDSLSYTSESN
jgi:hypothetical protein